MLRFIIIILFSAAFAEVFHDGPCPDIKPIENFDAHAFLGIWNEVGRYSRTSLDEEKCSTAEYTITSADKGRVKYTYIINGKKSYVEGDLTLVEPGKIMVTYTLGAVANNSYLTVLKTDYENYATGSSCKYFENDNNHQEFAWILTRSREIKSDVKTGVNEFYKTTKIINLGTYIYHDLADACKVTITESNNKH